MNLFHLNLLDESGLTKEKLYDIEFQSIEDTISILNDVITKENLDASTLQLAVPKNMPNSQFDKLYGAVKYGLGVSVLKTPSLTWERNSTPSEKLDKMYKNFDEEDLILIRDMYLAVYNTIEDINKFHREHGYKTETRVYTKWWNEKLENKAS